MGDLAGGPLFTSNVLSFSSSIFSFWWATSFIYYGSVSTPSSCTPLMIQYVLEQYQMWMSTQNLLSEHHWNQCRRLLRLIYHPLIICIWSLIAQQANIAMQDASTFVRSLQRNSVIQVGFSQNPAMAKAPWMVLALPLKMPSIMLQLLWNLWHM